MKQQHTLQPKLRFPEFEGDWKLYRLENLFEQFKSGNTITSKSIFDEGNYPVFGGNGLRGYSDKYTHEGKFFLIGRQGALCGNINRFEGKAFVSEHAIVCISNRDNNTDFLSQRLDYLNLNRLSESSAQPGLAVNKLLRLKLVVPSLPEQQKIADYLLTIDNKINLLEEKKAQLALYKTAMMQKLFSQEIRFKPSVAEALEAYPEWEEKRLGELLIHVSERNKDNVVQNVLSVSNIKGFISQEEQFEKHRVASKDVTNYKIVKQGEFAYNPSRINIGSIALLENFTIGIISPMYVVFKVRSELNANYFNYLIQLKSFNDNIKKWSSGSVRETLNFEDLSLFKYRIPSLPEQQKIADFLSAIDESIEKVNEQITQTQSFKKAMLQGMFV